MICWIRLHVGRLAWPGIAGDYQITTRHARARKTYG